MPESVRAMTPARLLAMLGQQRRLLSGLVLCGLLVVTGLLGRAWLMDAGRFPLEVVQVKGDFRFQQKEPLQQALAEYTGVGFFNIDVDRIRATVEAQPWIASAQVRRIWPATLRIRINEHVAVAHWNEAGFINAAGEVFFPPAGPAPEGLPRLSGPDGQGAKVLERYQRIARTLATLDLRVAAVALDGRRAWQLQLANGVELKLGRQATGERLQRFVRAYPALFAERMDALRRIDLRYNNGFSVRWEQSVAGETVHLPRQGGQEQADA